MVYSTRRFVLCLTLSHFVLVFFSPFSIAIISFWEERANRSALLDGDVLRRTSYGVYISQLIRFARASSNLNDFNYRNKAVTAKLLRQGYRYFKFRKAFSKFYRRHSALLEI